TVRSRFSLTPANSPDSAQSELRGGKNPRPTDLAGGFVGFVGSSRGRRQSFLRRPSPFGTTPEESHKSRCATRTFPGIPISICCIHANKILDPGSFPWSP